MTKIGHKGEIEIKECVGEGVVGVEEEEEEEEHVSHCEG